jgi:hypothetical protein
MPHIQKPSPLGKVAPEATKEEMPQYFCAEGLVFS